jgi:ketosteroid isomerase-like protein
VVEGQGMSADSHQKIRPQQAWAHREGKIDLRPLVPAQWGPEALSARAQIADAFYRFGMAWDEVRVDVLVSCFTEDALFESSEGNATAFLSLRGRNEMRDNISGTMALQSDQRRHIFSNIMVEQLDLEAGTAQALAQCVVTAVGAKLQLAAAVMYTSNLRREADGCWRFSYFFVGMDRYVASAE